MALTNEQISAEEDFMKGLPRVNLGALFIAPIWGPAHGSWPAFLIFVAWICADNVIFGAVNNPTVISVVLAIIMGAGLIVGTLIFAILGQAYAAHRAERMGISRETYIKRERIWAVCGFIFAVCIVALASWYNITQRPLLEAQDSTQTVEVVETVEG
jgi:hypothetical protein